MPSKEVSNNLKMLDSQIEVVERLAPTVADGSIRSEDTWPSIRLWVPEILAGRFRNYGRL